MKNLIPLAILVLLGDGAAAQEKPNPFTGTSAALEQRLRILEERKLDAAIAHEELAIEKANQERERLRAAKTAESRDVAHVETPKAPGMRRIPAAAVSLEPLGGGLPARSKSPRLVGTIATPTGWVALVEKDGEILNLSEAETVKGVQASAITQQSATINGESMRLEAVIARVMAPAALGAPSRLAGSPVAGALPTPIATPTEVIDLNSSAPLRK